MIRFLFVCLFVLGWSLPAGAQIATNPSPSDTRTLVVNYEKYRVEWQELSEEPPCVDYARRAEAYFNQPPLAHPAPTYHFDRLTSEATQGPLLAQPDFRLAALLRHPKYRGAPAREGMVGWRYRTGFGTAYLEVQEHGQRRERITNLFYDIGEQCYTLSWKVAEGVPIYALQWGSRF